MSSARRASPQFMTRQLLFFHGAGGYVEDRALADGIADALALDLVMPELPDEDMSFAAWASEVRAALSGAAISPDDAVVAHSFGASILLRVLADPAWDVSNATLLAMPDWSASGWDVADYAFDGPEPATRLSLHHCRDDEVVPFDHLALHAARLPSARLLEHASGGHQFVELARVIAADLVGG